MNARGILDQLMKQAGQPTAGSGDPVDRLLKGLAAHLGGGSAAGGGASAGGGNFSGLGGIDAKSLLSGGAIGLLIGSKRGRRLGGKAVKYGAIAGVGMLAWRAWQNYQNAQNVSGGAAEQGNRIENLQGSAGEQRSLEILQAMIMAARADGHLDDRERTLLTEQMEALGADQELRDWLERQMNAPLDAQALAREADSPQAAREMYLASLAIIDEQNPMEKAWLEQLAGALEIDPALAAELERQVDAARG
jgi:uncharacterized membrane protein YebE (DUF533 family)